MASSAPPVAPQERVADDHAARAAASPVVVGREQAAAGGHAQHRKEIAMTQRPSTIRVWVPRPTKLGGTPGKRARERPPGDRGRCRSGSSAPRQKLVRPRAVTAGDAHLGELVRPHGQLRRRIASISWKIAVLAPMPSDSDRIASREAGAAPGTRRRNADRERGFPVSAFVAHRGASLLVEAAIALRRGLSRFLWRHAFLDAAPRAAVRDDPAAPRRAQPRLARRETAIAGVAGRHRSSAWFTPFST